MTISCHTAQEFPHRSDLLDGGDSLKLKAKQPHSWLQKGLSQPSEPQIYQIQPFELGQSTVLSLVPNLFRSTELSFAGIAICLVGPSNLELDQALRASLTDESVSPSSPGRHSPLAAQNQPIWLNCQGSRSLSLDFLTRPHP